MSSGTNATVAHNHGARCKQLVNECLATLPEYEFSVYEVRDICAAVNAAVCGERLYREDRFFKKYPGVVLNSSFERARWVTYAVLFEQGYTAFPAHDDFSAWLAQASQFLKASEMSEAG